MLVSVRHSKRSKYIMNKIAKRILLLLFFGISIYTEMYSSDNMKSELFTFKFEGKKLSGVIDMPIEKEPRAIVILVPGSGRTDIVAGNWFYDLRSRFVQLEIACLIWDKAGCGKSEGQFDYDQTVQNSAEEVLTAITELKQRNISGSTRIGLWGISRAGWICPLVIEKHPSIAFWISVSGTDDKENFGYLLESNLRIEGRSEAQIKMLVDEWRHGAEIFRDGGSPEEYMKSTQHLQQDSFCVAFLGYGKINPQYLQNQRKFINEHHEFDSTTGLMIYVPNFQQILQKIYCPVLSISGEKDCNVDWRKTIALYKETIGSRKNADLTIKILQDCNHNIQRCKTGGLSEHIDGWQPCDGYYETMLVWLKEKGFGE